MKTIMQRLRAHLKNKHRNHPQVLKQLELYEREDDGKDLPRVSSPGVDRLRDPDVFKSKVFRERALGPNGTGVHLDIQRFAGAFIRELRSQNIPMYVHTFYRGVDDQERLFEMGRTKARFGESPHNFSMAADIVHGKFHWQLTAKEWSIIGEVGKMIAKNHRIDITWGGDWKEAGSTDLVGWDPAHWELTEWRELAEARTAENHKTMERY